ncbi:hypothetical protein [Niveispirillum irakense]|uniref:hypothetical protein n=1 Tax=Niveispirillum irakense TaxID=34011 RepID=UPI0012B5BDC8|nr:hypothetical protein [Niveispirillum irakense]
MRKIFIAFALLLSGCGSTHVMTKEQVDAMFERRYEGIKQEDVKKSAMNVLVLADGDDFKFSEFGDGFSASHSSTLLPGQGTVWNFRVREDGGVVIAKLEALSQNNYSSGRLAGGSALFDLFWQRLDYLVGKKSDWTTCDEQEAKKDKDPNLWGHIEALCFIEMKDMVPSPDLVRR